MFKQIAFMMISFLWMGCGDKPVNSIEEFNSLVKKIQKKNEEMGTIQKDMVEAVKQYNANRKADEQIVLPDTMMGLNQDQIKLIQNMIAKEKDLSYRGLLTQIVDEDKQLDAMNQELEQTKNRLSRPHVVQGNDTHYKVCLDFLVKEKLVPREKALRLLEETALIDEVRDGFNIWLYYNEKDDVFGTFVTQGTARISPNQFKYAIRKMQLDAAKASGKEEALKEMQ